VRKEDVKKIMGYYRNIPDMVKYERLECEKIEAIYYDSAKSLDTDGMPHGTTMGRPTEKMGIKAAQDNASARLEKAKIRIKILEADRELISGCLEGMNSKYKKLILWKLIYEYSWTKISVQLNRPESTCRHWFDEALKRLGEILENDVLMLDELVQRASRAR
jgi:DNA-directed RNA polymerase specialized sigma24 family protein